MTRVAVIGAGIAGLAAAWEASAGAQVTVLEASGRLGGRIETAPFAGLDLDTGADSFLARVPAAVELAAEVGLTDELVAPATGHAYLWTGGRLRPIPTGTVLGVPWDLRALLRSRVLPRAAVARAALDAVLPDHRFDGDVAVGELVRRRMGRRVQMGLVDPLIGGINAGHTDQLSAAVVAPQILAAAQQGRGLLRALPRATGPGGAVFMTPRGGLTQLVGAVARGLADRGASVVTGAAATDLARDGSGWRVTTADGRVIAADAVVVACPPAAGAPLVRSVSPAAADFLASIRTASVVLTTLVYPRQPIPAGSGFLVPRPEGRLLTASSWVGQKWPHLDRSDQIVIRASAGRIDDHRALEMTDGAVIDAVCSELTEAMGIEARPRDARVHRWMDVFPQFAVGHLDRVAAVEAQLPPGLALAGAALRGVGIATCISGARSAVRRLLEQVTTGP